jgi:hypothetical protein
MEEYMLYKIAVGLVGLWLLALLGGYVLHGFINILLGLAVIIALIDVRRKRSVQEDINRNTRTGEAR